MGRDWAVQRLTIEQLDHPSIGVDRVGFGRAALLALVVINLVDHVQETARGIECHEGWICALHLLNRRQCTRRRIEPKDRKPNGVIATATWWIFGVRADINERWPGCVGRSAPGDREDQTGDAEGATSQHVAATNFG